MLGKYYAGRAQGPRQAKEHFSTFEQPDCCMLTPQIVVLPWRASMRTTSVAVCTVQNEGWLRT